jgi:hypothetical protein
VEALKRLQVKLRVRENPVLFIDEISNVSTLKLALIDSRLQQATGVHEPFGALACYLVGDFKQNGPVAGTLLTTSVVNMIVHDDKREKQYARLRAQLQRTRPSEPSLLPSDRQPSSRSRASKKRVRKSDRKNKYTEGSAFRRAVKVLTEARWQQLTIQMRNEDPAHQSLLDRYERGDSITMEVLKSYKLLQKKDFSKIEEGWHKAPVIVATNREIHTLTQPLAVRYASIEGEVVYRWESKYTRWMNKPAEFLVRDCINNDGAFFEYFLRGSPCYITDNICKDLGLVNGAKAYYHSITPVDLEQQTEILEKSSSSVAGDIVTIDAPPQSINVELDNPYCEKEDPKNYNKFIMKYAKVTLVHGKAVVAIRADRRKRNAWRRTVIKGLGQICAPSKVHIKSHFPLMTGLAATVYKSQGMTLSKAILAVSQRATPITDFSYEALYVCFSRVKYKDHIRLLLSGSHESLAYIPSLRPQPSTVDFFRGYNAEGSWNKDRTLASVRATS